MTDRTTKRDTHGETSQLRDRLLIAPQDGGAMIALAGLLAAAGDLPGAVDLLQRALRVDPYDASVALQLGGLWAELGDTARARSWFERARAINPEDGEADARLDALESSDALTPAYVRTLFDQYAEEFDAALTQTLKYRAPILVARMLERLPLPTGGADILDLGCGTGLSGRALKPFALRLDGVDLSPGMIAKARALGIYATLTASDAVGALDAAERRWDVIAAIDMLNYVGDLHKLMRSASARLAPGGWFVGTVEAHDGEGAILTAKRRYAHSAAYLRAAAQAASLDPVTIEDGVLRTEAGAPVAGLIFGLRRV
jgi:predicted TPR repeat methyltransferase